MNLHAIVRVSIHAPAWGATSHTRLLAMATTCFNPRTRVGCDRIPSPLAPLAVRFQSTHPRGVRRAQDKDGMHFMLVVSIHAPAWGATRSETAWRGWSRRFNPRTRVGCDAAVDGLPERPVIGFNPRTRVGCDKAIYDDILALFAVSIHAPAWGATVLDKCL